MKCARLHLQQRSKGKAKLESPKLIEKPRRYCQKRLVNPEHEEDPRWIDIFERFHCNLNYDHLTETLDGVQAQQDTDDMVLTVQTLQFQGDVEQTKRPRTSFKYKKAPDGNKHRMFLKQTVTENELSDDDRSSQLTYYFDDYVKYLYNNDLSRPASSKSSIFLRGFSPDKPRENKATQAEVNIDETKKTRKGESNTKTFTKKYPKRQIKDELRDVSDTIDNTKVTYQKSGKRKSLTISRNQSPETVQVIRVDVVCNNNSNSTSDYEDNKKTECSTNRSQANTDNMSHNYFTNKYNHFANRYLLTNTIKSLDENLSGGAKILFLISPSCVTILSVYILTPSSLQQANNNSDLYWDGEKELRAYVTVALGIRNSAVNLANKVPIALISTVLFPIVWTIENCKATFTQKPGVSQPESESLEKEEEGRKNTYNRGNSFGVNELYIS